MKLDRIDKKLAKKGFIKTMDNTHGIYYEKEDEKYTHVLAIIWKRYGDNIFQSYDKDLFDKDKIGNVNIGISEDILTLCNKKMKKFNRRNFKWNYRK